MQKIKIENILNSFSGDFREIFMENSDFISSGFINGKLKKLMFQMYLECLF